MGSLKKGRGTKLHIHISLFSKTSACTNFKGNAAAHYRICSILVISCSLMCICSTLYIEDVLSIVLFVLDSYYHTQRDPNYCIHASVDIRVVAGYLSDTHSKHSMIQHAPPCGCLVPMSGLRPERK